MAHDSRCHGRGTSGFRSLLAAAVVTFSALSVAAQIPTPSLRDVFRRVRPTVVVIATRQRELAPEGHRGFADLQGLGSGVVVSEAGHVLTAAHVVQTADQIVISFSESVVVPARVISSSIVSDVALLQLQPILTMTAEKASKSGNSEPISGRTLHTRIGKSCRNVAPNCQRYGHTYMLGSGV